MYLTVFVLLGCATDKLFGNVLHAPPAGANLNCITVLEIHA